MRSERWEVQVARKIAHVGVFALIYSAAAVAAPPLDFPIVVRCGAWNAERRAQVEARIRTTLAAEGLEARRVHVLCEADGAASADVESEYGARVKPVVRSSERIEDDVVATVEAALRELLPEATAPAVAAAAAAPAPALAAAASSAPPAAVVPPAPPVVQAQPRASHALFQLTPLAERWADHWAWGADAGLAVGSENFVYGLGLGGRVATGEPATFDVSEWNATLRFAWTFPRAAGLRVTSGLGASLLVTTPASGVVTDSATLLGAAYFELRLGRPFWWGAFGLEPQLGARLFAGKRRVQVDQSEELVVPLLVPQAGLSLLYRPE